VRYHVVASSFPQHFAPLVHGRSGVFAVGAFERKDY
jgi:hypothetical protein